jgi:hypothetical protein
MNIIILIFSKPKNLHHTREYNSLKDRGNMWMVDKIIKLAKSLCSERNS